jgi:hypothetical protein
LPPLSRNKEKLERIKKEYRLRYLNWVSVASFIQWNLLSLLLLWKSSYRHWVGEKTP